MSQTNPYQDIIDWYDKSLLSDDTPKRLTEEEKSKQRLGLIEQEYQNILKKNPDRDSYVLEEGMKVLREAPIAPMNYPTADDLEKFGKERIDARAPGYAKVFGKGVMRGIETLAGGVGSVTRWAGEAAGSETVAKLGKEASEYWTKAQQEGVFAPSEDVFRGTFMQAPSLKRAVGIFGEVAPSLGAALVTGGTGMAVGLSRVAASWLAGGALGLLVEGAPQYEEAREKGKSVGEASMAGLASTAGTTILESLAIGKFLGLGTKAGKKAVTKVGEAVSKAEAKAPFTMGTALGVGIEGLQEASQQVWQNLVAKVGYDDTRDLAEGLVEALIGGAGAGGMVGGTMAKFNQAAEKARAKGATDEDIGAVTEDLKGQIETKAKADTFAAISQGLETEEIGMAQVEQIKEQYPKLKSQINDIVAANITKKIERQGILNPFKSAEESAEVFREEDARNERIRQSPEGARLLQEQLKEEEMGQKTPFQQLVDALHGKRGIYREKKLTDKQIEDQEFDEWSKKAQWREVSKEEFQEAKKFVDRLDEDKSFRNWYIASQKPYAGPEQRQVDLLASMIKDRTRFVPEGSIETQKGREIDAERIARPVEPAGGPEGLKGGAEGRIRLRDYEEGGMGPGPGEAGQEKATAGEIEPSNVSRSTAEGQKETIPTFKNTEEALAFGETATPRQKELLAERRAEGVKRTKELMDADDLNAAMVEGTKAQFDREALEAVEATLKVQAESAAPESGDYAKQEPQIFKGKNVDSVVHPSSKKPDVWQVTSVDKKGTPLGDEEFDNYEDAVNSARKEAGITTKEEFEAFKELEATPAPVPEEGVKDKEPWMMTRDEFSRPVRAAAYRDKETGQIIEGTPSEVHFQILEKHDIPLKDVETKYEPGFVNNDGEFLTRDEARKLVKRPDRKTQLTAHKEYVGQVLSEGKPVPPEVLADYPDLAKPESAKAKEPWETSNLATSPNILIGQTQARKQPDGTYRLVYRGTDNEIFPGGKFKSSANARQFFKAQQIKAQESVPEAAKTIGMSGAFGTQAKSKEATDFVAKAQSALNERMKEGQSALDKISLDEIKAIGKQAEDGDYKALITLDRLYSDVTGGPGNFYKTANWAGKIYVEKLTAAKQGKSASDVAKEAATAKEAEAEPYSYAGPGYKVVQTKKADEEARTRWRIEVENDEDRVALGGLATDVQMGEPGRRIRTGEGVDEEWIAQPSTYPEWMQGQGWTAKEVIAALEKAKEGKELGTKQAGIVESALDFLNEQRIINGYEQEAKADGETGETIEEVRRRRREAGVSAADESAQARKDGRAEPVDETGFDWSKGEFVELPETREQGSLFGKPEQRPFELTPEELTPKEKLAKAQDEAKRKGLALKGKPLTYPAGKGIKVSEVGKQRGLFENDKGQIELEFKPVEPSQKGPSSIRSIRQHTRMVSTGGVVRAASYTAHDRSDIASLLSKLRKHKQENLYLIPTDKDDKILEIFRYSKGTRASSAYAPTELAGHILNMPEAASAYLVHQHPSGQTFSSPQDRNLVRVFKNAVTMRDEPIDVQALVIAGSEYRAFDEFDDQGVPVRIKGTRKVLDIPVKEGVLVKRKSYASATKILSSETARSVIKTQYGGREGFLLMDRGHKDIGFYEFVPGRRMKETTRELIAIIEKANVGALVFHSKKTITNDQQRARYLKELIREFQDDVTIVDILDPDKSLRDAGLYERPETDGRLAFFHDPISTLPDDMGNYRDIGSNEVMYQTFTPPPDTKLGISRTALEHVTNIARRGWANAPKFVIVDSQSKLPPRYNREGKVISGAYVAPEDTVYLVAGNMPSLDFAVRSIFHEAWGHKGFDLIRENPKQASAFNRFLDRLYATHIDAMEKIGRDRGFDLTTKEGRDKAADEWLARQSEKNPNDHWVRRAIGFIRRWLAQVFPGLKVSRSEVTTWLGEMRQGVIEGAPGVGMNEQSRYQLAGEKAIGAPTGQLARAQNMLVEGKSEQEVWDATGWTKEATGKWAFRIDDSKAKINPDAKPIDDTPAGNEVYRLGDFLEHSDLYKAYPELAEYNIELLKGRNTTGVFGKFVPWSPTFKNQNPSFQLWEHADPKSTLLHEVQHAIQDIEGFARGSNPRDIESQFPDEFRKVVSAIEKSEWGPGEKDAIERLAADQIYRRHAGEIYAREAGSQFQGLPGTMEGIPRDQWIVRDGNGTSFSAELKLAKAEMRESRIPAVSPGAEGGVVDFSKDAEWHDIAYQNPTTEALLRLRKWLKSNPNATIRMYHGTSAELPIQTEGIKRTSARTRKSLQSRGGVVSLSIYPGMAEQFGRMAYPGKEVAVYAVDVPVNRLMPDADQLKNKRYWGERPDIGSDLASSIAWGHGAQIKGDISPDMLTQVSPKPSRPSSGKGQDKAYLDLAERYESGDKSVLPELQAMVDEAAKRAGYTVGPVWHGSPIDGITKFDTSGSEFGRVQGSYFTKDKTFWPKKFENAKSYSAFLKINNVADRSVLDKMGYSTGKDAQKWLIDRGYDGVVDDSMNEIVVFDPSQIKSADPITRDDQNRIIPLSERFNPQEEDIRYSIADPTGIDLHNPIEETNMDRARMVASRFFDDAMYWLVDKNRPVSLVQQQLGKVVDKIDVFLKETQRPKITAAKIKDAWNNDVIPLIAKMSEYKIDVQDLELYKHALHAPEANDALRKANAKMQVQKMQKILTNAGMKDNVKAIQEAVKGLKRPEEWYDALNDLIIEYKGHEALENTINRWNSFAEKPSGMTDKEAVEILKQYKGDVKIEELGTMLDAINDKKLRLLYESGLMAKEEYEAIANKHQHYVPLHREGHDTTLYGVSRGLKPSGRLVKVRGGSTKKVVNIIAHSIANYEKAINAAEKAVSQKALYELIRTNPDNDIISLVDVPKSPRHDEDGNLRLYPDMFKVAKNEMRLMIDGKQYIVSVDRDNRDAMLMMKTLKAEDNMNGPIINVLSKINKFLAKVNTSWSPEFIITNFVRDIQTAGVNIKDTDVKGKNLFRGAMSAWKAIYAVERGKPKGTDLEKYYERFRMAGGKIGWSDVHGSVENLAKKIAGELEMRNGKRPTRKVMKDWLKLIDDANTSIENGIRLHVFKLAIDQGKTDERAAQIASDLTVDFTKKGAAGPVINSLYLFANAGIQGSYRILRASAKSRAVRLHMVGIMGAGFVIGILNALAGGDDDDGEDYFNKIDDFIRERNMIFMLPGTKGRYVKIPLPWGYNVLWNLGSEVSRAFTKKNFNPLESTGRMMTTFANAFNPLASGTLLQTIAPTIMDPFVQVAENKNWFGGPLMPKENKFAKIPQPDSQRYWASSGSISKWIASQLNYLTGGDKVKSGFIDVSPETLNLIIDSIGGSALKFAKDSFGVPLTAIQGEKLAMHKVPFIRRVTGGKSEWADSKTFYENVEGIRIAKEQLKIYRGTAEYPDLYKATVFERSMIPGLDQVDKVLRKLRVALNKAKARNNSELAKKIQERIDRIYIVFNKRCYQHREQQED